MAFNDDCGGLSFSCEDAKMSIRASTWNTRLSQIARTKGTIYIMTGALPDIPYISRIIGKRPHDILIIANTSAEKNAKLLKQNFPVVRIALHPNNNAKVVLVSPETVWVSSSDFGKTTKIESAVGIHSSTLLDDTVKFLFKKIWEESTEII